MRIRPLSITGERRQRSATNLRSTAAGFPAARIVVKTWRMTHLTAPKAHTPASPPQLERCSSASPAHSAKHSTVSSRRMNNPHAATSLIVLWWTLRQQEAESDPGTTNVSVIYNLLMVKPEVESKQVHFLKRLFYLRRKEILYISVWDGCKI